jgi:hypothetical protein
MFYDVIVKYSDEPKERISLTAGEDSNCLSNLIIYFENPKLEYLKVSMSTYWRNKRND